MNAIVAPISPTATLASLHPAKANSFGTDAIYKGYDLMRANLRPISSSQHR